MKNATNKKSGIERKICPVSGQGFETQNRKGKQNSRKLADSQDLQPPQGQPFHQVEGSSG